MFALYGQIVGNKLKLLVVVVVLIFVGVGVYSAYNSFFGDNTEVVLAKTEQELEMTIRTNKQNTQETKTKENINNHTIESLEKTGEQTFTAYKDSIQIEANVTKQYDEIAKEPFSVDLKLRSLLDNLPIECVDNSKDINFTMKEIKKDFYVLNKDETNAKSRVNIASIWVAYELVPKEKGDTE